MVSEDHEVLILGGGVSGLTTAMALSKFVPAHVNPQVHVFEIRSQPGTVGGAINLTPNALRLLDYLGVYKVICDRHYGITVNAVEIFSIHNPTKLAESSFRGPNNEGIGNPPYKALRITRANLMHALIATLPSYTTIHLHLDHRCTSITQSPSSPTITAAFTNSTTTTTTTYTAPLLLGCDGVHSFTRNTHVDPSRKQIYTGVANAFGFLPLTDKDRADAHFEASALNFAPKGLLLTSYHEETRAEGYVGAIVAQEDVGSREGWRAKGEDAEGWWREMVGRFGGVETRLPVVRDWLGRVEGWFMWPVYMVPNGGSGRWSRVRAMLLGDASHAMPPQGESTGIVLEDGILFARCLWAKIAPANSDVSWDNEHIEGAFQAYEKLRRPRIEAACKESMAVVHSVQETGPWAFWLKTCIIPIFLRLGRKKRQKHFEEDVTTSYLGFDETRTERKVAGPPTAWMQNVSIWQGVTEFWRASSSSPAKLSWFWYALRRWRAQLVKGE